MLMSSSSTSTSFFSFPKLTLCRTSFLCPVLSSYKKKWKNKNVKLNFFCVAFLWFLFLSTLQMIAQFFQFDFLDRIASLDWLQFPHTRMKAFACRALKARTKSIALPKNRPTRYLSHVSHYIICSKKVFSLCCCCLHVVFIRSHISCLDSTLVTHENQSTQIKLDELLHRLSLSLKLFCCSEFVLLCLFCVSTLNTDFCAAQLNWKEILSRNRKKASLTSTITWTASQNVLCSVIE